MNQSSMHAQHEHDQDEIFFFGGGDGQEVIGIVLWTHTSLFFSDVHSSDVLSMYLYLTISLSAQSS